MNNNYNNYNSYNFHDMNNINNNLQYNNYRPKKSKKIIYVFLIIIVITLILYFFVFQQEPKVFRTIRFILNGADTISESEVSCQVDKEGHCYVTLPLATRNNGIVLGYSKYNHVHEAEYKINDTIDVLENKELYLISKKENILTIDKSNIDEITSEKVSCEIYNMEESCQVIVPMFNKLGYEIHGYTEDINNENNLIALGSEYNLKESISVYPVYKEYPIYEGTSEKVIGKRHLKIEKSVLINNNTYIDIGYNCSDSFVNLFIEKVKIVFEKLPFYAYHSKIVVLNENDYNQFAGEHYNSTGLTDDLEINNPTIVIKAYNSFSTYTYMCIVHELSHAFDIRYKKVSGHYLNEDSELTALKNKYNHANNRPLRDYAYSDNDGRLFEFFGELMTFYYTNYLDPTSQEDSNYQRGNFPSDMKKIAEKYICIGKNNYDVSKCN